MCRNVCDSAGFLSLVWEWEHTQNSGKGLENFWGNMVVSSPWPKLLVTYFIFANWVSWSSRYMWGTVELVLQEFNGLNNMNVLWAME